MTGAHRAIRLYRGAICSFSGAAIIVGLAFLILVGYGSFKYHLIGDYGIETDFYWDYAPAAQGLQHGLVDLDRYRFRGPGYPLILAAVSFIVSDIFTAGRLLSLLSAGWTLLVVYSLFRSAFGPAWGFLGVLALITNGTFVEYSFRVGTDMPYLALCAAFFYLLVNGDDRRRFLLVGFVAGMAYLTRYNGAALVLVALAWALFSGKGLPTGKRLERTAVTVTALAITIGPWLLYLYLKTGDPFNNPNISNIAYELYGRGKMVWDRFWFEGASHAPNTLMELVRSDPIGLLLALGRNLVVHIWFDFSRLIGWPVGVLVIAGLIWLVLGRMQIGRPGWVLISGAAGYLVLVPVFYSPRFSLSILPVYFLLVGLFFTSKEMTVLPGWWRLRLHPALIIVTLSLLYGLPGIIKMTPEKMREGPTGILEVANDWSIRNLPYGRIAARKPHAPFILGQEFVPLPQMRGTDNLIAWMKREQVDYLFLNLPELMYRPALAPLLAYPESDPRLTPVYVEKDYPPAAVWWLVRDDSGVSDTIVKSADKR